MRRDPCGAARSAGAVLKVLCPGSSVLMPTITYNKYIYKLHIIIGPKFTAVNLRTECTISQDIPPPPTPRRGGVRTTSGPEWGTGNTPNPEIAHVPQLAASLSRLASLGASCRICCASAFGEWAIKRNVFFPLAFLTFSPQKAHFPQTPALFPHRTFQCLGYLMKLAATFRV